MAVTDKQALSPGEPPTVLILDFGSQYTQLIARRVRQLRVYCEIHTHTLGTDAVRAMRPAAIILSGGPASVYDRGAPDLDRAILEMDVPILGICYGLQLLAKHFQGQVVPARAREYGRAQVRRLPVTAGGAAVHLLDALPVGEPFDVWMSHGDHIERLPEGFVALAATDSTPFAAIVHRTRLIAGLQFHPEVSHTPRGLEILEAFLYDIAGLKPTWTMGSFLATATERARARVGESERVICALSGGVDSSVVAALLALPEVAGFSHR